MQIMNNPGKKTDRKEYIPKLIAFELTRTCNLNCTHCRAGATGREYKNELSTEEVFSILRSISSFAKPIIILTGGEPMMRDDIFEIARYGNHLGMRMVMAPCGYLITDKTVEMIKESGIQRISLSIDGATAASHDNFRRKPGAFERVIEAAQTAKKGGLSFQVNTTVYTGNVDELPGILNLAIRLGASGYHPFLLIPTGRAKNLIEYELSSEKYEEVLNWIYRKSIDSPIPIKPTCAPHYYRIMVANNKGTGNKVKIQKQASKNTHPLHSMTKGCMGGQSFAFISHTGKVYICGFLELEAGDLREQGYNFKYIWDNSRLFKEIRNIDNYHGKCGYCEFRRICSGCRARAYNISGDYLGEEPFCIYEPLKLKKMRKKGITANE